jgi:hypothetical protein
VDAAFPEAPSALADLVAAGLVSHEMIGDPAQLGPEAEALRTLCGLVAGPVWRVEAFHYAFRAGPQDLGGRLGGIPPEGRTAALEAALKATLGADAVWLSAVEAPAAAPPADLSEPAALAEAAAFAAPLAVLRAHGAAVEAAVEAAGPGLMAVVNARFAADVARLAASAALGTEPEGGGDLSARLAALEAGQAEVLAGLGAQAEIGAALARLTETLGGTLARLEAQAEVLEAHIAREDMVAGRLAELSRLAAAPSAFQETLGVTLAEVLARLERRAEEAAPRVPQVG